MNITVLTYDSLDSTNTEALNKLGKVRMKACVSSLVSRRQDADVMDAYGFRKRMPGCISVLSCGRS